MTGADGTARDGPTQTMLVVAATILAWTGFFVHNVADLPGQNIVSPETLYPTLFTLAILVVRLVPVTRTWGAWLLLGWSVLNLVGGALSVLPLTVLPFTPEQSVKHYAFHGLYAATQLPLIWVCISWLQTNGRPRRQQVAPRDSGSTGAAPGRGPWRDSPMPRSRPPGSTHFRH